MTINITSLSEKHSGDRQSAPNPGDKVYLYGDRTYTGTLIHTVERTSPPLAHSLAPQPHSRQIVIFDDWEAKPPLERR